VTKIVVVLEAKLHLLVENCINQQDLRGFVGISFDCEHLTEAGIQQMNDKILTSLVEGTETTVYMNPKEAPGVGRRRQDLEHSSGNSANEKPDYQTTLDILAHQPQGAVMIPAYTFVPASRSAEGRDRGVNVWDAIALAQICREQDVQFKLVLGISDYDKNVEQFRASLRAIKEHLPHPGSFAYFKLAGPPHSYCLLPQLLSDVRDVFGYI
jgi:hypothetical protein